MNVWVTGAEGQLGTDVVLRLERQGISVQGTTLHSCDITKEADVRATASQIQPDAIIHCAAYTAVDKAETEQELCFRVNAEGTKNVAHAAQELGAKLLYISTDYVFDGTGNRPYRETDPPHPINVYGASKYEGELHVQNMVEQAFVIRTSWVFGHHGPNFVKTMLRLGQERDSLSVVADQVGSPTYTPDLAEVLVRMLPSEEYGVYHATNAGTCSWYEFAKEIFTQAQVEIDLKPIPTDDYPTPAQRPLYSVLSKDKLASQFFTLRNWKEALKDFTSTL
ncbi:MAG: dTDP-4-dehydrorhamnose reductase [Deltaproteobacteria bacterium]|nr:MAG: dTDP-4-dehydrorhamnose reductase [Deltaproteobacteria bacterium]